MIIGIRPETKHLETRIGLTPIQVSPLVASGHEVILASGSGVKSGFTDDAYRTVGARIVPTHPEVFAADLLVGVKEPQAWEFDHFRPGQQLASYFHVGGDPDLVEKLEKAGISCLAYELIQTADGALPVLAPMSLVAGALSVIIGAELLRTANGGAGVSLSPICGWQGGEVLVYGCGNVGRAAIQLALDMRARVTAVDRNPKVLARMNEVFAGKGLRTINNSTPEGVAAANTALAQAHLVVGAVLIPGRPAPKILTEAQVATMMPGSVIVDVAIDEGGCVEGTLQKPVSGRDFNYIMRGNGGDVRYFAQPNMPSQWGNTASAALADAFFPFLQQISDEGLDQAIANNAALKAGLIVHNGVRTPLTTALLAGGH